jgi:hypothetical protein
LKRSLSFGKVQVRAFALYARALDCPLQAHRDPEHVHACFFAQLRETLDVPGWSNQQVTRVRLTRRHNRYYKLIPVNNAGGFPAVYVSAE